MPPSPEKLKKLEKLAKVIDGGDIELLKQLDTLEENVEKKLSDLAAQIPPIEEVIARVKDGRDGHTPTEKELLVLIRPLIPPPAKDGHTPTDKELLALIKPLIPKVKDGATPTKEELVELIKPLIPAPIPGKDGADGHIKDLAPQEVRDLLELLQGEERLDVEYIRGVEALIERISKRIAEREAKKNKSETTIITGGSGGATSTGAAAWGDITGTLSAQTDLQTALDAKADNVGNEDIEITDTTKGIILKSPNGTRWRIGITNNGELTAVSL